MKRLFILFSVFLLSGCSIGQTQFAENGLKNLNNRISKEQVEIIYNKTKSFPENTQLSIAIIEKGIVNYVGIIRQNDSIIQIPNHKSAFEIGSISKVFTATLLSNFIVNNKLEFEDNIQEYIKFELKTEDSISFKMLANHTSGLPRLPSNLYLIFANRNNPYKNYDKDKLESYLKEKIKLNQAPGGNYEYSNLGAGILGYLLADISNSSYEEMLQEFIFKKYVMSNSSTDRTRLRTQLVKGLDPKGKETPNWDLNILAGAGGVLSTIDDMTQFALVQFNEENTELKITHQPTFEINESMDIGLGWHIIKASDEKNDLIWHNGGTGGYTSSMALDVKNKNGVIILSNVSAFNKNMGEIDNLCFELTKTILE